MKCREFCSYSFWSNGSWLAVNWLLISTQAAVRWLIRGKPIWLIWVTWNMHYKWPAFAFKRYLSLKWSSSFSCMAGDFSAWNTRCLIWWWLPFPGRCPLCSSTTDISIIPRLSSCCAFGMYCVSFTVRMFAMNQDPNEWFPPKGLIEADYESEVIENGLDDDESLTDLWTLLSIVQLLLLISSISVLCVYSLLTCDLSIVCILVAIFVKLLIVVNWCIFRYKWINALRKEKHRK